MKPIGESERPNVTVATRILVVLLIIALGGVLLYTMFTIGAIVALFLLSLLFAFILAPAVNAVERLHIPRTPAVLIVFTLFFGGLAFLVSIIAPFILSEIMHLQEIVSVGQMRRAVRDIEVFITRRLSFFGVRRLTLAPKVEEWVGVALDNVVNIASGVVGLVLFVVMLLISTFFLLKDARSLKKSLVRMMPNGFFETSLTILYKIERAIGDYLRGILLDAASIAVITTFALWLIDLPYYFLVGLFAGFANLVPYLGPPTAAVVAAFISIVDTGRFDQVPLIAFVFIVIRLFDDAVVQPLTISRSVRQHPLVIIFVLLIGGQLFGIIGMLFAVPVVGVIRVLGTEILAGVSASRSSPSP
ncbi:MAG: AI-2E family transporter [Bacteroidota bacterium]|nr:AI-2E family transporter [Bacteroidota bacterium]